MIMHSPKGARLGNTAQDQRQGSCRNITLLLDSGALSGGARGVTGAVAGAGVVLCAALDGSIVDLCGGAHEHISLGVVALSVDKAVSDSLGVLHSSSQQFSGGNSKGLQHQSL